MKNYLLRVLGVCLLLIGLCACLPSHLAKYRKQKPGSSLAGINAVGTKADKRSLEASVPAQILESDRRVIALDGMTFRFQINADEVWESLLNVLIKNYNLAIVDRENGVVSTDWDSFYLDDVLYRNKVSIRIQKKSYRYVDVAVHNSVEKLQNIGTVSGLSSQIWVPTADRAQEVSRIVQNMAIILGAEPPDQAPGSLSKLQDPLESDSPASSLSY